MIVHVAEDRDDLRRWLLCGAIVLCAHATIVAAFMQWREPILQEGDFGNDVILLELRPEQVQAEPTPEKPVEQVEKKPDPPPEQQSEVMLQPETPVPQTQPVHREEITPAPATTAAQSARARAAATTWRSQIASTLEHNKRYPQEARARREQGVAQLAFSIDREGHVLSSRIVTSTGFALLDEETLALVQRAQPFPVPPPEVPGDEIKFMVPVRFSVR
jgi:periplasmic protein TonB